MPVDGSAVESKEDIERDLDDMELNDYLKNQG
jgi:hypothetical protein